MSKRAYEGLEAKVLAKAILGNPMGELVKKITIESPGPQTSLVHGNLMLGDIVSFEFDGPAQKPREFKVI